MKIILYYIATAATAITLFSSCGCSKLPIDSPVAFSSPNRPADTVVFAVIGDYGTDSKAEADVAAMVKSWQPEFVITTGDNNYPVGSSGSIVKNIGKHYCDFIYNPDAPSDRQCKGPAAEEKINRFFPCPGNHDNYSVPALRPYTDYFTLPGDERNYDFIWGTIHFFSLNTGVSGKLDERTIQWLQQKLKSGTARFKIVYFHHPPYSSGGHGSNEAMQLPFGEWGADAVLCGHDHFYERILDKNSPKPVYFIIGNSGNENLYSCNSKPLDTTRFTYNCDDKNYGAVKVKAGKNSCTFEYYTTANPSAPADVWVIVK
ncbi:MAG: metallophosphoesterase [Chitinophagales bacterium]|nr:metallophosphoesterase [Chitinophagales bacterium]MDW8419313.1 metallophosphoesterase [Chitinophagales bacterium]